VRAAVCLAAAALALVAMLARPPEVRALDDHAWDQITAEATDLLSQYIRLNTTNPPGNELDAAELLKTKFSADGIPSIVYQPAPGRGVIAARLRGSGKLRKSLVLLSHMDVVPADAKDWQVAPFSGTVKNGEIWGRGALDDKGPGVIELMAILAVKRSGILLDRDILFLATGDEETGGKLGAGWVVEHQRDLVGDAGYLLNEGGEIHPEPDGHKFYEVSVTEKSPLWIRLTASGPSGHASNPPEQTAVTRLIKALNKVANYQPPIKIEPIVEREFRRRGALNHRGGPARDLRKALKDPAFAKQFLSVPSQAAMLRDTIAPTVLRASEKINVIPSSADAEIDCRLLPGEDAAAFIQTLRGVIGDDNIRVEVILNFPSESSPEKSTLMKAIETLADRDDSKASVIPTMLTGFTDSHYFRRIGLVAYGFIPLEVTQEQARMVHGANERISIDNLRHAIERMASLLRIMGDR
jgi:acetylornithine deacetylase/succinyl-diaminopimelate desuccinylase-like protein